MALQLRDYDLLPVANETFRVTFDWFTPRPHFIILPKDLESIQPPDFSTLNVEQIVSLIRVAHSVLSRFNIPNATLSIHRGTWKSKPKKETPPFHAHICVDTVTYLKIFSETVEENIPDLETQIQAFKTGEWLKGSYETNVQAYKESVRGYPRKNYFDEEVDTIRERKKAEGSSGEQSSLLSHVAEFLGMKVDYHTKHPMIGFVGKKTDSVEEMKNVLPTMEGFAKEKGMTKYKSENGNDGCHLCLYLGSDWHYNKDREEVLGYIVTSGPRFYQLGPEDRREKWFEAFQYSFFKCLT